MLMKNEELKPYYIKMKSILMWEDGLPYYTVDRARGIKKGDLAGTLSPKGYRVLKTTINGIVKSMRASRVRWFMHYGNLPELQIDHIKQHEKDNNRLSNLRALTPSGNCFNRTKRKGCKTNYLGGTYRDREGGIFEVRLYIKGGPGDGRLYIGRSRDAIEAAKMYDRAIIDRGLQSFMVLNFPETLNI